MPKVTIVTSLAGAGDARLADRHDEVVELRHLEALAVEDLVLEEDHRVRIADRRLEQALGVGGACRARPPSGRECWPYQAA